MIINKFDPVRIHVFYFRINLNIFVRKHLFSSFKYFGTKNIHENFILFASITLTLRFGTDLLLGTLLLFKYLHQLYSDYRPHLYCFITMFRPLYRTLDPEIEVTNTMSPNSHLALLSTVGQIPVVNLIWLLIRL